MVEITCYGGVAEIGGNKVLLEDEGVRFLFDFGTPFGRHRNFFNEYLRPRAARGLLDLLSLGLLPPLKGLYRADLTPPGLWERFRGLPSYRNIARQDAPAVDAVLISHAHLDHNGDLAYLDPCIPIYCTRVTAFIARAMQLAGRSGFEQEASFVNLRIWNDQEQVLKSESRSPCQARACTFLDGLPEGEADRWWKEAFPASKSANFQPQAGFHGQIAGREVRWWAVDHSVPGAAAFAVHTSAGWVVYSGDLRFHGRRGREMDRVIQEMADLKPAILICEGTHLEGNTPVGEDEVAQNAGRLIREAASRLVVADFAPRNIERLQTFLQLAQECGRQLVIQPKDALLLEALFLADPCTFPDPLSLSHLALYADPKSAPRNWEKGVHQRWHGRIVAPGGVSACPGDYILCFSLWDANDLLDLGNIAGGLYLYSNSRAYDEEQAVDLERLRNWVRHVELRLEGDPDDPNALPLHSSGHAPGPQLLDFVQRVHPQVLIPIHTERPEWWAENLAGSDIRVIRPEADRPIAFS